MSRLWDLAVQDPHRTHYIAGFLHDMARYSAGFRARPGNAYGRLVGALGSAGKFDGTVFATLNYECLLEQSLEAVSKKVAYFDDIPSQGNSATCWKLHGSCNFVPIQEMKIIGIALPIDRPLGPALKAIAPSDVEAYCKGQEDPQSAFDSPLVPTMSIFAPGKPVPFAHRKIAELQASWARAVAVADVVAVIGVQPNPVDRHIWDPLATTNARVVAVGGPGGVASFDAWQRAHRPRGPFQYLGDRFDPNVDTIVRSL